MKSRALEKDSLWLLTISPSIWAAHFLLCYLTAAVWCAKFATPGGSLGAARTAVIWYTAVALIAIGLVGREGFRRHTYPSAGASTDLRSTFRTETTTHDLDSPEDRHRFLGFATLLLSGLSGVAVVYAATAAAFFDTCR
jgi:hypothetical protein